MRRTGLAAADVGLVHQHLPVEAAGAHQRRVEHLGAIGRGHDDDGLARIEAVHFRQQLVERLLALFVAAHRALHAHLAQRVELVDEDDAGRLGFGLGEQIAHPRGAHADEHLDELRSGQAEERAPWPRRPRRAPAASCRCPEGRPAARPWESCRRGSCTSSGSSGTRRSRAAPAPLRPRRPRPGS